MEFKNDASMVGFIGDYKSVDEVVAKDTKELEEIGGSFEAIANRLSDILRYAKSSSLWTGTLPPTVDEKVVIASYVSSRGFQVCPYGCKKGWSELVKIVNPSTGRELTINKGIEHLIRDHHLLEKGNEYGISAKAFYAHFMPDN